jgi:hypothetical protein
MMLELYLWTMAARFAGWAGWPKVFVWCLQRGAAVATKSG